MAGPSGDPRVADAAARLIEHPSMTTLQAMTLARFSKKECNNRKIQQNISKRKTQLLAASNRMNAKGPPHNVTIADPSTSMGSSLTDSGNNHRYSSGRPEKNTSYSSKTSR
jgi:hypothetical protein